MKRQTDDPTYAARMQAMYDRSNEKPLLREKLEKILRGRSFRHALDVGPGPGFVTEILAQHSKQLTLVEITPSFEKGLRQKFPDARVIIDSIGNVPLKQEFDAVLYSQGLYYQKESEWFSVCKRLHDTLLPGGLLMVVMNTDSGDYWEVVDHCWKKRDELRSFHLKPWSEFKKELGRLGASRTESMVYSSHFTEAEFDDYIGGGLLAVPDRDVFQRNRDFIHEYCQRFRNRDGNYEMNIHCEVVVLEKK